MVANADKVREIGTKEAEREKLVRLAELAKDAGIGKSRAELEQQSAIKDQERQMRVQVADAEAAAVTGENLARAKVVDAEAT
jgi:flotillin